MIGTFGILRALIRFNTHNNHPLFKAEERHLSSIPLSRYIGESVRRAWKPLAVLLFVTAALAAADFMCSGTRTVSTILFQICSIGGGTFILFCLLLLTYLWPLSVAVASSGVIVQERERQTWDVLLTTPLEWQDILLIKLSAALRRFNPYVELFLWMQGFLMVIIVVLVIGAYTRDNRITTFNVFQLPLVLLTVLEFGIARAQDYVIAGLIGLFSSLLSPTRQAAGVIAVMLATGMVLLRALVTALIVLTLRPTSVPGMLILLSTGPSSVISIGYPAFIATLMLVLMVVSREVFIRAAFQWLTARLGDGVFDQKLA